MCCQGLPKICVIHSTKWKILQETIVSKDSNPIGVNKLASFLPKMFKIAGINDGRDITGHSGKVTCCTELYNALFDEQNLGFSTITQSALCSFFYKAEYVKSGHCESVFVFLSCQCLTLWKTAIRVLQEKTLFEACDRQKGAGHATINEKAASVGHILLYWNAFID